MHRRPGAPTAGSVVLKIDGKETSLVGRTPEEIVGLGVALVPEGRRLFPALTVEENLMLGAYRKAARRNIAANLDFVLRRPSRCWPSGATSWPAP